VTVITASMAGYALSRRRFRGKAFVYAAILAGIMIPPQALIVPLFREFQTVHLINTYWALILPQVPAPIAVFIFKKFFDGVPISLEQAAEVDVLSGGRLRLGIGIGWNEVEFTGLNEEFHNRGKRSADQVRVMQALWAEPHVKYESEFHTIDDAGINPRPASGRVPIWYGGHAEATFRRAAKYGDGFMPLAYPMGDVALAAFGKLRGLLRENGRDPANFGFEVWVSPGTGNEDDWRNEIQFWKNAGVTHVTVHTTYASPNHQRIAGKTAAEHLAAITRYKTAVADLL